MSDTIAVQLSAVSAIALDFGHHSAFDAWRESYQDSISGWHGINNYLVDAGEAFVDAMNEYLEDADEDVANNWDFALASEYFVEQLITHAPLSAHSGELRRLADVSVRDYA